MKIHENSYLGDKIDLYLKYRQDITERIVQQKRISGVFKIIKDGKSRYFLNVYIDIKGPETNVWVESFELHSEGNAIIINEIFGKPIQIFLLDTSNNIIAKKYFHILQL